MTDIRVRNDYETISQDGTEYEFFDHVKKGSPLFEILRGIKKGGDLKIIIRPQAFDKRDLPLRAIFSSVYVELGEYRKLEGILHLFITAAVDAEIAGVRISLHG